MIVRLKVQGVRESVPPFFSFNSMIVRLKELVKLSKESGSIVSIL